MAHFAKFTVTVGLFLFSAFFVQAQKVTISGKITDELSKDPLVSATVLVKGTTIGAATDVDGIFKFDIPDTNQVTLVFSYVGYEDREIVVKKPFDFLNVALK